MIANLVRARVMSLAMMETRIVSPLAVRCQTPPEAPSPT